MTQPAKPKTGTQSVRVVKVAAGEHMVIYRQGNRKLFLESLRNTAERLKVQRPKRGAETARQALEAVRERG